MSTVACAHSERLLAKPLCRMACSSRASAFAGTQVPCAPPTRRCGAAPGVLVVECAHKKGAGSVKNGQDSESKRLGVKIYGDQPAFAGNIILRQRGTVVRRPAGAEVSAPPRPGGRPAPAAHAAATLPPSTRATVATLPRQAQRRDTASWFAREQQGASSPGG